MVRRCSAAVTTIWAAMFYTTIAILAGMLLANLIGRLAASRLFGPLPEGVTTAEIQDVMSAGAWRRSATLTFIGIFGVAVGLSMLTPLASILTNANIYPTLTFVPMILAFLAVQLFAYRLRRLASFEALHRRGERSVCTRCSYVLAGSVSAQCPECGLPLVAPDTPDG